MYEKIHTVITNGESFWLLAPVIVRTMANINQQLPRISQNIQRSPIFLIVNMYPNIEKTTIHQAKIVFKVLNTIFVSFGSLLYTC